MGPSCGVADVREDGATVWSASQGTHRYRMAFAEFLGLKPETVRLIFVDGSGSYGTNGHDDAAADAALISQALKRPVRVQWTREDEHGWDPKGPPQLLDMKAGLDKEGRVIAWAADAFLPAATRNLPNVPLLGPIAAGLKQTPGLSTGQISQNINPPYAVQHQSVTVHWLKTTPLRPSNIRAPGKIANSFAVESLYDELAEAAGADPYAFRLAQLEDRRGREVLERTASRFGWKPKAGRPAAASSPAIGQGIAYVHYKHNETYVALAVEVAVDRASGEIRVTRAVCAQDCGLMINPDTVRQQVEGGIIQTISRTLKEAVTFDRGRVTSVDWATYPILTFPEVPTIECELIQRVTEKPVGVGEAPATPVPAAIANAVYDAVGIRLREVPFTPERVKSALQAKGA
jgi:CO/xanthine dehydrogenase Mo-binding subunit